MHADIAAAMPGLARHEGVWEGVYRHLDGNAALIDQHHTRIVCELPKEGPYAYIQHNHFWWPDGREVRAVLPGILRDGRLWWDTATFHGYGWETLDGIFMLNLTRKDEPGANFYEMINLGADGLRRARIWHWFKDGALYRRTLCDEVKVG